MTSLAWRGIEGKKCTTLLQVPFVNAVVTMQDLNPISESSRRELSREIC